MFLLLLLGLVPNPKRFFRERKTRVFNQEGCQHFLDFDSNSDLHLQILQDRKRFKLTLTSLFILLEKSKYAN